MLVAKSMAVLEDPGVEILLCFPWPGGFRWWDYVLEIDVAVPAQVVELRASDSMAAHQFQGRTDFPLLPQGGQVLDFFRVQFNAVGLILHSPTGGLGNEATKARNRETEEGHGAGLEHLPASDLVAFLVIFLEQSHCLPQFERAGPPFIGRRGVPPLRRSFTAGFPSVARHGQFAPPGSGRVLQIDVRLPVDLRRRLPG